MRGTKWVIAAFLATTMMSAQPIEYFVEKPDGSMYSALRAKSNGKTYTVVDESKEMCLAIADQRDWDGNGFRDALVERITACGGNCCPNSYFFVSASGDGRFQISKDLADSWKDPIIEKWKNTWSVVIISANEGVNTDRPKEVTRRFVLRNGTGIRVSESTRKDMESIVEMRSEIFKRPDEEHRIDYDLDGDGKKDAIVGRFWERWGRIFWEVEFADGKEFRTDTACKRIGVLGTATHGVHDLVCDQDTIYRWTGDKYAGGTAPETPAVKPSFDCSKATTRVEILICRDSRLAGLEVEMVTSYKQALGRLSGEERAALERDHSAWFRAYIRECNAMTGESDGAACVARRLTAHTAALRERR